MLEHIANAGAWFGRIFKVVRHGNAIVKEQDAAVAPLILLVRNIHDAILSGPFDANEMQSYMHRLSSSEDDAWSDNICFDCRKVFLQHARRARRVLEKHGSFRNDMESGETHLYMDNACERLIAALSKSRLPKRFDPFEDEPSSRFARLNALWSSRLRGRS